MNIACSELQAVQIEFSLEKKQKQKTCDIRISILKNES